MGKTLKDLKFLLEKVLLCELEEGRKHTQYFLKVNDGHISHIECDILCRKGNTVKKR